MFIMSNLSRKKRRFKPLFRVLRLARTTGRPYPTAHGLSDLGACAHPSHAGRMCGRLVSIFSNVLQINLQLFFTLPLVGRKLVNRVNFLGQPVNAIKDHAIALHAVFS